MALLRFTQQGGNDLSCFTLITKNNEKMCRWLSSLDTSENKSPIVSVGQCLHHLPSVYSASCYLQKSCKWLTMGNVLPRR